MTTTLLSSQRKLAAVWFTFSAITFILLLGQTIIGDNFFVEETREDLSKLVWQWWLPQVLPTLGLVLGVLANLELAPTAKKEATRRMVSGFFLRLTMAVSIFYLMILLAMLLVVPLKEGAVARISMLQSTSYFLGPLQALIGAALGVFFVSSHTEGP